MIFFSIVGSNLLQNKRSMAAMFEYLQGFLSCFSLLFLGYFLSSPFFFYLSFLTIVLFLFTFISLSSSSSSSLISYFLLFWLFPFSFVPLSFFLTHWSSSTISSFLNFIHFFIHYSLLDYFFSVHYFQFFFDARKSPLFFFLFIRFPSCLSFSHSRFIFFVTTSFFYLLFSNNFSSTIFIHLLFIISFFFCLLIDVYELTEINRLID